MQSAEKRREWVLAALDEYEVRLLRYALRLLGDADLARDCVQHAFLKLCDDKVAGTLRVPSPENGKSIADDGTRSVPTTKDRLAAWLFRVCRNRAVDQLRQAGREESLSAAPTGADNGPSPPLDRELDPAEASESRELAVCLRELIAKLPTAQREAIDLWCEGFCYREIAEITSRQEGHIRVLVHRGLTRLREHPRVRGWLEESRPPTPSGYRSGEDNFKRVKATP
jgi:RNA polymerase sigma factor (sigma-70 family)